MINQLGRYEVVAELGQGAMGVVYKAIDPLIDRVVAIKTINLNQAEDEKEEYEGRFYQEAKAAGRLSHPNIVTIYDVGREDHIAYIAMEFLEGRELRDILNDGEALSLDQILDIVAQVALGLAYAHENGIVHRDVKPSNIMVGRDGHVKITDFGIARMASSAVRTQTGMVLGSPKYMSPEQVVGKELDQRSDIFSLGSLLYEMLTGRSPFDGENVNSILYQVVNTMPTPPSIVNPDLPEMLNFIVAKALAKNVEERYQNARELAEDLKICRNTLLSDSAVVGKSSQTQSIPGAIVSSRRSEGDDAGQSTAAIGLSKSFDSFGATMRLAAMTNAFDEVETFSKKYQETHGAVRTGSIPAALRIPPERVDPTKASAIGGNLLLILIVMLVLAGVMLAVLR